MSVRCENDGKRIGEISYHYLASDSGENFFHDCTYNACGPIKQKGDAMKNFLVRFVKRGHVWTQRQTVVLCERHIVASESKGDAVISLCESVHSCVSCTFAKKVRKGK
jgi:hypothetical protein